MHDERSGIVGGTQSSAKLRLPPTDMRTYLKFSSITHTFAVQRLNDESVLASTHQWCGLDA